MGACGILKVKPPPQPQKLQPWQAYQALTYKSKWKPHINKAWSNYKKKWQDKHSNLPIDKTRFELINEFLREKFELEMDKMKKPCEKYWKPETRHKVSPVPVKLELAANAEYQV